MYSKYIFLLQWFPLFLRKPANAVPCKTKAEGRMIKSKEGEGRWGGGNKLLSIWKEGGIPRKEKEERISAI